MSLRLGIRAARPAWLAAFAALAATAVSACNRDPVEAGEKCTRSSECDEGLVCIEGACSHDLSALPNQGTVPELMMDEEAPMDMPDGGADMGMEMDVDMGAGSGADAAVGDAGTVPPPDAGL